jgi:hypothetical protein
MYILFNGSNIISADNIDININAPLTVAGGEPVSFDVEVANRNNIKLESIDVSADFPSGTVDVVDTTKELKNTKESIPDIEPGSVGDKTFQAVFYGEENTKKQVVVTVEYRVSGSSSTFKKEKTFEVLISSSPLNLTVSAFKEVNSGQEFEFSVQMNSNSKEVIKNVLLKAVYPFGFTFISSDTKLFADTTVWKIGDIPPNGKKTIKIRGKIDGQDEETRVFKFITGAPSLKNDKIIGTEYVSTSKDISIKKPFMTIGVTLDGDSESIEYVGRFNNSIRVDVDYHNNLPTSIIDGEVHVKLSGTAYDKTAISSQDGLYRSENNEIIWNTNTTRNLKNIPAGSGGRVSFNIIPKDASNSYKTVVNPDVSINVSVNGKRNSETSVPESFVSSAKRHIKVASKVSLSSQVVRSTGPFTNTGPVPPKAENETTYTVIWTVDNTSSSLSNTEVKSSLPPYVKWLGKVSPSSEDITYNSVDGNIVWNVGNVGTYTLNSTRRRQVAFQVSMTPSITQVNQTPILVNQASLTALDDFTNLELSSNLNSQGIRFGNDPTFKDGDDRVVR